MSQWTDPCWSLACYTSLHSLPLTTPRRQSCLAREPRSLSRSPTCSPTLHASASPQSGPRSPICGSLPSASSPANTARWQGEGLRHQHHRHPLPLSLTAPEALTFLLFLKQEHACLRPFAHAVYAAWNAFPTDLGNITPSPPLSLCSNGISLECSPGHPTERSNSLLYQLRSPHPALFSIGGFAS